jgi:hypothetical protein
VLVLSNDLGPDAGQARCLKDLESVWEGVVRELAGGGRIEDKDGAVSKTLKLVYRLRDRAGEFKKRSAASSCSSDASQPGESKSPEDQGKTRRGMKKSRADSEDMDLQRAIQASLEPNSADANTEIQESAVDVMQEGRKDEKEGVERLSQDIVRAPGGWISNDDDLQRAIRDSIKSFKAETGKEGK